MSSPILSIVIPTYNRKLLVARAINSVIKQNVDSCEVVVVDDGSDDGTWPELIGNHCWIDVKKLRFNKNRGVNSARNHGVIHSSGDYLLYLDSDDYLLEGSLVKILRILSSNPALGHFWFNRIDGQSGLKYVVSPKDGSEVTFYDEVNNKYHGDFVHVIRRSFMEQFLFFEEFRAEEYLNWYRIARNCGPAKYFDINVVVCCRSTKDSLLKQLQSYDFVRLREKYYALCKEFDLFGYDYFQLNERRYMAVLLKAVILGVVCEQFQTNSVLLSKAGSFGCRLIYFLKFINFWYFKPLFMFALALKRLKNQVDCHG